MRRRLLFATGVVGLSAIALSAAWAEHVRIDVVPQHAPSSTTVIVPGQTAPAPTQLQTLNAEQIKANVVRADTIYANRIEANEVRGQIHQSRDVKIGDTRGEFSAPEVTASVIYADEITANSVVAHHVYVRDLRRK